VVISFSAFVGRSEIEFLPAAAGSLAAATRPPDIWPAVRRAEDEIAPQPVAKRVAVPPSRLASRHCGELMPAQRAVALHLDYRARQTTRQRFGAKENLSMHGVAAHDLRNTAGSGNDIVGHLDFAFLAGRLEVLVAAFFFASAVFAFFFFFFFLVMVWPPSVEVTQAASAG
jgi:hypothetical protein